ncbi:hypothetical protein ACM66B_001375 [Microbotryomycetes sp. NB124-2]
MQNVELRELQLKNKWRSYLIKAGFLTASEVLLTPPPVLAKKTKLPPGEVSQLLLDLSTATMSLPLSKCWTVSEHPSCIASPAPPSSAAPTTMDERPQRWITSGDNGVDALLGNGIPLGTLTEIAGQSASGKSHLCLQLALTAQFPSSLGGVLGGTLFISSEGIMPSSRLLELARHAVSSLPPDGGEDDAASPWDFLDNVHTEKAQDVETLESLLSYIAPAAIERVNTASANGTILPNTSGQQLTRQGRRPPLPIKLVIVDSIAAPFRVSHATTNSAGFGARAKEFGSIGLQLKRLAHVYDCAVVVVNQISDAFIRPAMTLPIDFVSRTTSPSTRTTTPAASSPRMADGSQPQQAQMPAHEQNYLPENMYSRYQTKHFSGQTVGFPSVAALGHSWSNVVNTRVMLRRGKKRRRIEVGGQEGGNVQAVADERGDDLVLVRHMSLVFSPFAERASLEYIIDESGVRSLEMPRRRESMWRGDTGDGRGASEQNQEEEQEEELALWAAVEQDINEKVLDQVPDRGSVPLAAAVESV